MDENVNGTPHRAHLSRATHAFCLVAWLKMIEVFCRMRSVCFLEVIPSHPCVTAPLLTHSCPLISPRPFLHLHLVRLPLPRCYTRRCLHPLPLCKEGYALADWLNNLLSHVMSPKSLIEVSSEHTPIILPSRRGSLDTNVGDLATTLDASEVYDTTDVGRLTAPLFSQEREVNATPFSVCLFSDTFKHGEIQARRRAAFKLRESGVGR